MQKNFKQAAILSLSTVLMVVGILSLACKPSAEKRAEAATTLMRQMEKDLLAAQKKEVDAFKALPEADAIRIDMGDANFDTWSLSEKCLSKNEEIMDAKLVSIQKDARDEALIGEYRIYAKGLGKTWQGDIPVKEDRGKKYQVQLSEGIFVLSDGKKVPMDDSTRKTVTNVCKMIPMDVEYLKDSMHITDTYVAKLEELLK